MKPIIRKITTFISYVKEREKLILRKKFVKIIVAVIMAVNYFCKTLHPRYLTGL